MHFNVKVYDIYEVTCSISNDTWLYM